MEGNEEIISSELEANAAEYEFDNWNINVEFIALWLNDQPCIVSADALHNAIFTDPWITEIEIVYELNGEDVVAYLDYFVFDNGHLEFANMHF